jgi:formylglycine-generating enzyme required for sulfatase activity
VADVLADCEAQLKANARLKDYSRIPRSKPRRSGRRKWVAAAAAVLLPVIALVVTESAGVTHLFRGQQATSDTNKSGSDPQAKAGAAWSGWPADAPPPAMAPFDAAQARAHQEAWAKYLGVPVEFANTSGMKFQLISPGTFTMGSSPKEIEHALSLVGDGWEMDRIPVEGPAREVEITQPFYMGVTEVTVGQFRQFVEEAKYVVGDDRWKQPGFDQFDDYPVVFVSWDDAVAFCAWLSKKEGKTYRLPTEAEWEYSCRAGKVGTQYCFGDDDADLEKYAWYGKNSGARTHPVGKLKPNDWGLYDMHGNAWEWCQDYYDPNYYKTSRKKDPPGGTGRGRVLRGGAWDCWATVDCRSAFRDHSPGPGFRKLNTGFRIVLVVSPPAGVGTERGAKDKPSSTAIAPFADADVQRIAALPAEEQAEEVRKELMRRNPGFDGKVEHKIEGGVVTELRIVTDKVTDIAPIRVWGALRVLDFSGTWTGEPHGLLADLTPLKGMNLAGLTHLNLSNTKVTDAGLATFKNCKNLTHLELRCTRVSDAGLVHFQDCKALTQLMLVNTKVSDMGLASFKDCKDLQELDLWGTKVTDAGLIHFKDCKALRWLVLEYTQVSDAGLAHFKGVPLRLLRIDNTGITDLTPLQGMPLEEIRLTPKNITRGLDILRAMKSLKTIGTDWLHAWPAAEFWERYDNGEFKE